LNPQLIADTLDATDVNALHHNTGLCINIDLTARAFKHLALHGFEQSFTACTLGGLGCFVDHAHAVIATHGHEVRPQTVVGFLERCHELFVQR
jgi:hypothetical protein